MAALLLELSERFFQQVAIDRIRGVQRNLCAEFADVDDMQLGVGDLGKLGGGGGGQFGLL
jgi:hypothetical protein